MRVLIKAGRVTLVKKVLVGSRIGRTATAGGENVLDNGQSYCVASLLLQRERKQSPLLLLG
jgi:hypothetical protein